MDADSFILLFINMCMKIGVIAIQGNVQEHIDALSRVLSDAGVDADVVSIKHAGIIPDCSALVIPGGESTTLSRLMGREGMIVEMQDASRRGIPIMGTCAGLVLLAKRGAGDVQKTGQQLLGLMDIEVNRNAFGRQVDSFETDIVIPAIGDEPFNAVFIRAPEIVSCGEGVEVLAKVGERVVAARQGNLLALSFHPELTGDMRLHRYFLDMVKGKLSLI